MKYASRTTFAEAIPIRPLDPRYQSGFASELATEALPGALPVGRNSPQRLDHCRDNANRIGAGCMRQDVL